MPNGGGYEEDVPKWLLHLRQTVKGQPDPGACSREGTPFQITKSRPQEPLTMEKKFKKFMRQHPRNPFNKIAEDLIKDLGLPKGIVWFQVLFHIDKVPKVRFGYYPLDDNGQCKHRDKKGEPVSEIKEIILTERKANANQSQKKQKGE